MRAHFSQLFIPLRRRLQQFLDRFDVAGRKGFGAILAAIESAPHFIGKFLGESKGQNHPIVGFAVEERVKVALERHAEFPDGELLLALAVFHNPEFEYAQRWVFHIKASDTIQ